MDQALQFHRGLLGMDVVFDQTMTGAPFDHALGGDAGHQGRVVGGLIGGGMLELLSLGAEGRPYRRSVIGNQNISLSVTDLDATFATAGHHASGSGTGDQRTFGSCARSPTPTASRTGVPRSPMSTARS
ncbi:VOC family protein [Mycolicibacterium sp. CH28]|uniref:VOC family protein n=1 Tax=Mycolicibacterium sp. CH28 TaxID=2512237 RepID=UPI001F26828A|nr:hypothetical protein [Mycolicibacterium sp. CH28]